MFVEKLKEFHQKFGVQSQESPTLPAETVRTLRVNLLSEEWNEYLAAEEENDLVEIADALADMIVIILGTADVYGIPMREVYSEVMASNMSKLDPETGLAVWRDDGKILKGANFFRPKIKQILDSKSKTG